MDGRTAESESERASVSAVTLRGGFRRCAVACHCYKRGSDRAVDRDERDVQVALRRVGQQGATRDMDDDMHALSGGLPRQCAFASRHASDREPRGRGRRAQGKGAGLQMFLGKERISWETLQWARGPVGVARQSNEGGLRHVSNTLEMSGASSHCARGARCRFRTWDRRHASAHKSQRNGTGSLRTPPAPFFSHQPNPDPRFA